MRIQASTSNTYGIPGQCLSN